MTIDPVNGSFNLSDVGVQALWIAPTFGLGAAVKPSLCLWSYFHVRLLSPRITEIKQPAGSWLVRLDFWAFLFFLNPACTMLRKVKNIYGHTGFLLRVLFYAQFNYLAYYVSWRPSF